MRLGRFANFPLKRRIVAEKKIRKQAEQVLKKQKAMKKASRWK